MRSHGVSPASEAAGPKATPCVMRDVPAGDAAHLLQALDRHIPEYRQEALETVVNGALESVDMGVDVKCPREG